VCFFIVGEVACAGLITGFLGENGKVLSCCVSGNRYF